MPQQPRDKKKIGLITAIAIVVANMVGTGVFTSLGFQLFDIQTGFPIMMLWFLGGIFALCGALVYGELGASMPRSGGEYHYLSRIYHPAVGFASGWISATVGFAAPVALAAMALGKYMVSVTHGFKIPIEEGVLAGAELASAEAINAEIDLYAIGIAVGVVLLVSIVHSLTIRVGSLFQNFFTGLKLTLILILIGTGIWFGIQTDISFSPVEGDTSLIFSGSFAISLFWVMYSYSGWNASTYIANEIHDPERNLPRSLFIGTAIVMVLYILINGVFLSSTPVGDLMGKEEVGLVAAQSMLGESGGKIMGLLIALGLISAISSMIWAGPRVTMTMGEDIPFFKLLAKKTKNGIPVLAIFIQTTISVVLVLTATFEAVLHYTAFTLILSSFVTVMGVFVARIRFPEMKRPYRTWAYPIPPIIFLAISLWMMVYEVILRTQEAFLGLATVAIGVIIYFLTRNLNQQKDTPNSNDQSLKETN